MNIIFLITFSFTKAKDPAIERSYLMYLFFLHIVYISVV